VARVFECLGWDSLLSDVHPQSASLHGSADHFSEGFGLETLARPIEELFDLIREGYGLAENQEMVLLEEESWKKMWILSGISINIFH
jgi:hypothetical protein